MKPRTIAAAMLALALSAGAAAAQPAKSFRDQIVGTWNFVVAEITAPDGKKSFPFGETPKGILIFTADGRFDPKALIVLRQSLVEMGILQQVPDDSVMFTTRFLPVKY